MPNTFQPQTLIALAQHSNEIVKSNILGRGLTGLDRNQNGAKRDKIL